MKRSRSSEKKTPHARAPSPVAQLSESAHRLDLPAKAFPGLRFCSCEYAEGPVGMTYIDFGDARARCYTDVRGGWPSYIVANSRFEKQLIDGIVVAGGSNLGLEAATGVVAEAWEMTDKDPLAINSACIFSGNLEHNRLYPDKALGQFAFGHAQPRRLYSGQVGAGASARKGQGVAYGEMDEDPLWEGVHVLCVVVNNAMGNIYRARDGKQLTAYPTMEKPEPGKQTTITTLITDLDLDVEELQQLSHQLHCAMAVMIRPFNTYMDGDVFYACSTRTRPKPEGLSDGYLLSQLYEEMTPVLYKAIKRSIVNYEGRLERSLFRPPRRTRSSRIRPFGTDSSAGRPGQRSWKGILRGTAFFRKPSQFYSPSSFFAPGASSSANVRVKSRRVCQHHRHMDQKKNPRKRTPLHSHDWGAAPPR